MLRSPVWKARLASFAGRAADGFPLTRRGVLVAAVAGAALWAMGYGALDLVVFVMSLASLILVAASLLLTLAVTLALRLRPRGMSTESRLLSAGAPVRTGFSTASLGFVPFVTLRWEWMAPAGVGVRIPPRTSRLVEEVFARERAEVTAIVRRFRVGDVFGLTSVSWRRTEPVPLTILPDPGRLRGVPLVHSMSGGDVLPHPAGEPEGDRMEIRRYAPGDPVRAILWKQFARTGKLNIRLPERALAHARRTVAYLVAAPADEAAAAAARVALETGALGPDWLFGADGTAEPHDLLEPALRALARSAGARGGTPGLGPFLEAASRQGQVQCIVFVPAEPGPWLPAIVEVARRHAGRLSFVVGTDGVRRETPRPRWHRWLYAPDEGQGTKAAQLSAVLRGLSGLGAPTIVVDRLNGRSYGEAHQQALRA